MPLTENSNDDKQVTRAHSPTVQVASNDLLANSLRHTPAIEGSVCDIASSSASDHKSPLSPATRQLNGAVMQLFEPSMLQVKGLVKELIGKQNKLYIDVSTEKFKLDNAEINKLNEMMNDVKNYREKLIRIKKQMQNIYQRTKLLKKRAAYIQSSKEKELHRKLKKQQQEQALIGKQEEQPTKQ